MDQLPRLSARRATLLELREIVRAMRVMAAGDTREGEAALAPVLRYSEIIEDAVADAAMLLNGSRETAPPALAADRQALCLIGSEHGFVGDLNARLIGEAIRKAGPRSAIVVIGHRAAAVAAERGISVHHVLPMTGHVRTIPLLARRVAEQVAAYENVAVAYFRRAKEGGSTLVVRQISPFVGRKNAKRGANPPFHNLPPSALLRGLADEYLMAEIARALTEAFVCENTTRLTILTTADKNIHDKLEGLERDLHRLRQEIITSELLDIVVGAEAIAEGP